MYRAERLRKVTRANHRTSLEQLESRVLLDASGIAGNDCIPDLEITQQEPIVINSDEVLDINLFDELALVSDLDAGETIRLQLDPDDGPQNATLTPDGDFRWDPTSDQIGSCLWFELLFTHCLYLVNCLQ